MEFECTCPPVILRTAKYEDIPEDVRKQFEKLCPRGLPCDGGGVMGEWCKRCLYCEPAKGFGDWFC